MTRDSYYKSLHVLGSSVGGRNAMLVKIALQGLSAGILAETIAEDIAANCGQPPLSEREIRRAVERAQAMHDPSRPASAIHLANAVKLANVATDGQRGFMAEHSSGTATSADLMALSPLPVASLSPLEQARAYVATVFPDDRHFVFATDDEGLYRKRTFDRLVYPSVLAANLETAIPNYCIANQFTGRPSATGSHACMDALITRRLTLIEFDSMPLASQCAFWVDVIRKDLCPGLRTLVWSGSKSIHALVRMSDAYEQSASETVGADGFHETVYNAALAKSAWDAERAAIEKRLASASDTALRLDTATKDPTRLTRFAGATRTRKDGTTAVQRLLWCAVPNRADMPVYDGDPKERALFNGWTRPTHEELVDEITEYFAK